jgi:SHAQKYF class myb-like DNA-binding protein
MSFAAAAAAASSPSLNREEHTFGKNSKEQMSFAALSAAAATSSPLQNREEHSFGKKSSNETMASQALPGQGFAALASAFLSQNRVEQSLEESSKETEAFILPHEAFDSIASSPTRHQVVSLPQETDPSASTTPICSKKKTTKNQLPAVTPFMRMAAAAGPLGSQGENTGRWTAQEHKLFLKGLGKFGNDAKKIQSVVKSRTIVQIRTHAQKYFRNLAKKTGAIHNPGAASCNQSHVNGSTFEKQMRQRHVGVGNMGNMNAGGSRNTSLGNVIADDTILNSEDAFRPIATKTAKKNQAASINDADSQGKVESVASTPSTQDIHTTQETSHDAKMLSGQDKTKDTKSSKNIGGNEMPSNGAGANGILARDTKEKLPDDPLHHRNLISDTLSNNGTARGAEEKSPRKPHHHRHLNEETLKMLKSHLQADRGQHLDEDAVAARTIRMERIKRSIVKHDPSEISDKEDNDAGRQQAHQNAEDYVLALDFYKKVVADTRKENSGTRLDKKTLDWVRRAMGLHRHSDSRESTSTTGNQTEQSIESDDEAELQGSEPRRLTRGAVRNTRVKKREQRAALDNMGLDALLSAAASLEEEFGPFTDSKSRVSYTFVVLNQSQFLKLYTHSRTQSMLFPSSEKAQEAEKWHTYR